MDNNTKCLLGTIVVLNLCYSLLIIKMIKNMVGSHPRKMFPKIRAL